MKPVVVLDEAARDIETGRDFYESSELGVGDYFVASLLSDLESLRLVHGTHSTHFGCHRMLATRFPFGIYYDETDLEIRVFAVLDLRRDPTWIRSELQAR